MSIIWTIVIGFVAGVIAKLITPGDNEPSGFILTTILGIVGATLGIVTGLLAATVLVVLAGGGPPVLDVPWASLAAAVVLGVAVSMAAAWYPARLASRLAIVAAVQHE